MSEREPNHTCLICKKQYYACNDCDKKKYITWRSVCCCERHFQIYMIVNPLLNGHLEENEATDFIKHLDLSDDEISSLKDNVKNAILRLLNRD